MSYIEDAIYSYFKRIFTRGIIVLTNKRFLTYSLIAILVPLLVTTYSFIKGGEEVTMTYNILFNIELAACVGLIITGLISLKNNLIKVEHLVFFIITGALFALSFSPTPIVQWVENLFVYFSFYSWVIITNLSGLLAIREFIITWPGWVMRLGDNKPRVMFEPIIKFLTFASIAWFTYSVFTNPSWSLLLAFMAGTAMLYTLYVFFPYNKDANMTTIISFFYLTLLYHLFVPPRVSTGFIIFDISLIVAATIYTAQSVSSLISRKKKSLKVYWDSFIIILLGLMLGYHLLSSKLALTGGLSYFYTLYHDIAFGFGTLIMFAVLILYTTSERFRELSEEKVGLKEAVSKVSTAGLKAAGKYFKSWFSKEKED